MFSLLGIPINSKDEIPRVDYEKCLKKFSVRKNNTKKTHNQTNIQRVPTTVFCNENEEVHLPGSPSKVNANRSILSNQFDKIKHMAAVSLAMVRKNPEDVQNTSSGQSSTKKDDKKKRKLVQNTVNSTQESKKKKLNEVKPSKSKSKYPYVIKSVLGKRVQNNHVEYLIKWRGYSDIHNSWEPIKSFAQPEHVAMLFNGN